MKISPLKKYYIQVLKLFLASILLLSLTRISLFLFNQHLFPDVTFQVFLKIFTGGLIFDLSAFAMVNIAFLPFFFLPFKWVALKNYQKVLFIAYSIVNILALIPGLIDIAYFPFSGKRMTADFFAFLNTFKEDLISVAWGMFLSYWYLLLILIVLFYLLYRLAKRIAKPFIVSGIRFYIVQSSMLIFSLTFAVLLIRGGFRFRPLNIIDAGEIVGSEYASLSLNSTFSLIKTFGKNDLEPVKIFSDKEANLIFPFPYSPQPVRDKFERKNIVIIIVESLNAEYMGCLNNGAETYTPFLDSLAASGLIWDHTYANATRSIEGIPAILSSFPVLQNTSFTYSQYSGNNFATFASLLKQFGYKSAFFHGGKNGTMGFNSYCLSGGFDKYYSLDDYPDSKDYDGNWGIFDEPYLQYVSSVIDQYQTPFITAVFTLSSHHPYKIPEKYKGKLKKGKEPMLETINYTDLALRHFFNTARNKKWYKNTLFVITADHTSVHYNPDFSTYPSNMQIPVIMFSPADSFYKGHIIKTTSQNDILPSVLHSLGFPSPIPAFGRSVFDTTYTGISLILQNGIYKSICQPYIFESDLKGNDKFTTDSTQLVSPTNRQEFENFTKALIQQYNNRMINNKLIE